MSDRHYQKIIEGLDRDLDPWEFEKCACSILRDEFPTLVPVLGGSDAGMDGAIADGEGEAYPLIVTTGKTPLANLRTSLDAQLGKRFPRHKAVFATSRPLTPQMRRKLEAEARTKGFTLVQIVDQAGIADRLFHNSSWCRSLLGLAGTPSALSVVPLTRRPLLNLEPIGRDADLAWLESTPGDRVLVGEPGSGKTFLLYHLARQGKALFLVDEDLAAIANAVRDQQPAVIVVDDAQINPEVLARLRHLREDREGGGDFSLVAITWKGALDQVVEGLGGVPRSRIRQLELLTRDELVQVIEQVGVHDREWIRLIVDQSGNKPGLAVTQARLALQGELQDVLGGTVLRRTLVTAFRSLTGRDPTWTLGVFGLGGDAGMSIDTVAGVLGSSRRQLLEEVTGLAAGGVLTEVRDRRLAVYPRILRWNLVARVFFSGAVTDQRYDEVLDSIPSLSEGVETILGAVARAHAVVPETVLRGLVSRVEEPDSWRIYANLGESQSEWVLEHFPGDFLHIAWATLQGAPEAVVPRLLERAVREKDWRSSGQESQALRTLSDWVRELDAQPGEWLARRRLLTLAAKAFLASGGDRDVGIQAVCLALSPALEGRSTDPGMGRTINFSYALLPEEDLRAMSALWSDVRNAVTGDDLAHWQHFSTALWDWIYPDYVLKSQSASEEVTTLMHGFAREVLVDLARLARQRPGARSKIRTLSRRLGSPLDLELDPDFERLFPEDALDQGDWRELERRRLEEVEALALQWSQKSADEIAQRLVALEREAAIVGQSWPRLTPVLAQALSRQVADAGRWLHAFLKERLPGDVVEPFLRAITNEPVEVWRSTMRTCLGLDAYAGYATSLLLTLEQPPSDLLAEALERADRFAPMIGGLCLAKRVPVETLGALLRHPNSRVAIQAAVGEWESDPRGEVRAEVSAEWRVAVLGARADLQEVGATHGLGLILASDSDLALNWLQARLDQGDLSAVLLDATSPIKVAIQHLTSEQRSTLLHSLRPRPFLRRLLPELVGDRLDLYQMLLAIPTLADYHLSPLFGLPDESWAAKAVAALDAGKSAEEIAQATIWGGDQGWTGSGADHWRKWADAFARFERAEHVGLRAVARSGTTEVERKLEKALEEERRQRL